MHHEVKEQLRDAQSRVETNLSSRARRRECAAWSAERAFGYRVVLLVEFECNRVADRCADVRRGEREHARPTDNDLVVDPSCGCRPRCRGGRGRRARHRSCRGGCRAASRRSVVPERVVRRVGLEQAKIVAGVHRKDHALLTVICLPAEHPCRVRRLYVQLCNDKARRLCRRDGLAKDIRRSDACHTGTKTGNGALTIRCRSRREVARMARRATTGSQCGSSGGM